MKRKISLLTGCLLLGSSVLFADSNNSGNKDIKIPTFPVKEGSRKNKRDITSPIPMCSYSDGTVYVYSESDWSFATVYVSHDQSGITVANSGYLDERIEVNVGTASGSYTVTIVTETDAEFTGSFTL